MASSKQTDKHPGSLSFSRQAREAEEKKKKKKQQENEEKKRLRKAEQERQKAT